MTPEQVSALSDTELNRAMIWLYPPKQGVLEDYVAGIISIGAIGGQAYLTDYNLTMPLVIEKGVTVIKEEDGRFWAGTDIDAGGFIHMNYDATAETYLRAACECLVLIALEAKKW